MTKQRTSLKANQQDQRKSALITGASGFIGFELAKKLIQEDWQVSAIVRRTDPMLEQLGVDVVIGDLLDEKLQQRMQICFDVVFHCAGDAKFGNGPQYQHSNVEITKQVLALTKSVNSEAKFILLSSIGAVDRNWSDDCTQPLDESTACHPTTDYGQSKQEAERLVVESGLRYTIIRPTMVVGEGMRTNSHFRQFAKMALSHHPLNFFSLPGSFSIIDVRDLVAGMIHVAEHDQADNELYFAAGSPMTLGDFFTMVNPKRRRLPLSVPRFIRRFMPFKLKALFASCLVASDQKLRDIGWQPNFTAEDALLPMIEVEKALSDIVRVPVGQTVITGAGSGLGRAIALRLAPMRENLLLLDKDKQALSQLKAEIPHARCHQIDLSNQDEIESFLKADSWTTHPISELFMCAGIGYRGDFSSLHNDAHQRTFSVNLLARVSMMSAVLDQMMKRKFGRILIVSSSSAFQPLPLMASYAASNAALLMLGEAVAHEVRPYGVHVQIACPGGMKTNFQRSANVKEIEGEKLMLPEEVADHILNGFSSGKTTLLISSRTKMMALMARILPRSISVKLWAHLMGRLR